MGPSYAPTLQEYTKLKSFYDPNSEWLFYSGHINYDDLHKHYHKADLGIFISSCENLPIILLETMAAGLPIVASDKGPMPEVLGRSAFYCDPENTISIKKALSRAIQSEAKRTCNAKGSYQLALDFSWEECGRSTMDFLISIANQNND